MTHEQPRFEGRIEDEKTPEGIHFESITGVFAQTTGAPTWTPKSLHDSIAIDVTNSRLYIYNGRAGAWVKATLV